ncbi:hypothetical protein M433DRAFT_109515 [Acidomyces richmondensis BFW]|nr:hypothetical protein M433DRAFT_109515 [Acidomyces richmondensis BFW]
MNLYPDRSQIRLLHSMGISACTLRYEIPVFFLTDGPWFTAPSYSWGTNTVSKEVIMNGVTLQVRTDPHSFLHLLISEGQQNWIFIDALCIKQGNIEERNNQVKLMGSFYAKAMDVFIWL